MPKALGNATSREAALRRGKAIGTIYGDAFAIVVPSSVLEEILDFCERDLSRERGGFLCGRVNSAPPRSVEVRHFLPAVDAQSRAMSLVFTHDTWAAMTREVTQRFPNDTVVGWHHTHPGFGIFLSAYDLFIQRHFFNEPWQIALVVDPRRQELGFFQWREGRVVDCGFVCVDESDSEAEDA
jgi:proteasome lid subunit RPN8/RPN11